MPKLYNIHQAKTHLSRLLADVERGETIAIARAGVPVALLVPAAQAPGRVSETGAVVAPRIAQRGQRLMRCLEREVWPAVPADAQGRPLSREDEDRILGYGPDGV